MLQTMKPTKNLISNGVEETSMGIEEASSQATIRVLGVVIDEVFAVLNGNNHKHLLTKIRLDN